MLVLLLLAQTPITVKPPSIATADGITVGLTTVQQFERKFGKGFVHVGGHSNGGRYWYDISHHVSIDTDGFDFAAGGEIIDFLSIEFDPKPDSPAIRVRSSKLGILKKIRPGMSRRQVERALHIKLIKDSVIASGVVAYSKNPGNKDNDRFTSWRVDFDFEPGGLRSFEIIAD